MSDEEDDFEYNGSSESSDSENGNESDGSDSDSEGSDNAEDNVEENRNMNSIIEKAEEDPEDPNERFDFEVEDGVANFEDEIQIGRNIIPDSSDEDEDPIVLRDRRIRRVMGDKLVVGSTFFTSIEFKEAVLEYALRNGKNVVQNRWEKEKISFKCGMRGKCKWRVYCSFDKTKQLFVIKTSCGWHSCTPNGKCKFLKSPVIARLFLDKLRLDEKFMPMDIQKNIKERWKLVSTIPQCQRGRLLALKWIEREYAEQFAHLRGYIEEIHSQNPGSVAFIETYPNAGEDVFNRFYVCFNILRTHWAGTCRPILGLDGTFLKVAVKGVLLTAVGHDANNQIYPVAWAVVQSENADNWLWFVKQIKKDLNLEDGSRFVIISDRSKGLLSAVKNELPFAEHRMCVKHIVENLKKNHAKKDELKTLVWQLAWSYNEKDYAKNINNLRCYDDALYNDVMREEPHTWSRCFYRLGSCCEDVDNNATESFNSTITKARAKSLVPMLETIRRQGMTRITKRKKKSLRHQGRFSEYASRILELEKTDADRCTTYRCTHGMFEVYLDGSSHRVELQKKSCSCGKWQITGIPCEHAYGAMIDASLDPENYISGYFLTDMWRETYDTATYPLRGPRYWMHSGYRLITAPPEPILPGRKKGSKKKGKFARIKGKNESPKKKKKKKYEVERLGRKGRTIHCKSCGEAGHNTLGCKKFPKEKVPRKRKSKDDRLDELQNKAKKAKKDKDAKTDKKEKKEQKEKNDKKEKKVNKEKKRRKEKKRTVSQGPDMITITQPSQVGQITQE